MFEMAQRLANALWELAPIAALFVLLALVTKRAAIIDAIRRCRGEARTNFAMFVFDVLLVLPFVALPSNWLVSQLGVAPALAAFWGGTPVLLTLPAAVIVGDFVGYWRHRLEHSPAFWPAHATHHSDEAMGWLSLHRIHPINRLTTVTIDVSVLAFLGFPPAAIAMNFIVRRWWGHFIHADIQWTLGGLGRLLISPPAHKVHHARDEGLAGSNFATVFTIWDRMFGTYRDPIDLIDVTTGIEGGSRGFAGEILRPFAALYASTLGRKRPALEFS